MVRSLPTLVTLGSLCCGLISMHLAYSENFRWAIFCIVMGCVLDGLDGRLARKLRCASELGTTLDSLCDVVTFGVAPAILLYFWNINTAGPMLLGSLLLYVCACAYHLAVFNADVGEGDGSEAALRFIIGLPVPVAAGLVLLPIMLSLQIGDGVLARPGTHAAFAAVAAVLTASRVPFYSMKDFKYGKQLSVVTVLLMAAFAAGVVLAPWWTLGAIVTAYMASTPFAVSSHRRAQLR